MLVTRNSEKVWFKPPLEGSVIMGTTSVLIKVRIRIDGIDEYATIIKTLIIPVYHPGLDRLGIPGFSKLTVTNIPIPREE